MGITDTSTADRAIFGNKNRVAASESQSPSIIGIQTFCPLLQKATKRMARDPDAPRFSRERASDQATRQAEWGSGSESRFNSHAEMASRQSPTLA